MDAHDLYGLPLDRFTLERGALAKELRQAGRRDEAEAVAALRKPSVAAWAVNQLVRTQGRDVARLFAAGDGARHAQAELLSGRSDPAALRDALAHEREQVDQLVDVARGLLSSDGHELSRAALERVADTLHAAALDEEARAEVSNGCLHRELRHVGMGAGDVSGAPATRPRRGQAARSRPAADLSALRKAEAKARRAAERAVGDLEDAQERREAAAAALEQAEAAVAAHQQRAKEAEAAYRDATRDLEQARRTG